jgi:hypothetical protein
LPIPESPLKHATKRTNGHPYTEAIHPPFKSAKSPAKIRMQKFHLGID